LLYRPENCRCGGSNPRLGGTQIECEHIPVKVLYFNVIKPTLVALANGKYSLTGAVMRGIKRKTITASVPKLVM